MQASCKLEDHPDTQEFLQLLASLAHASHTHHPSDHPESPAQASLQDPPAATASEPASGSASATESASSSAPASASDSTSRAAPAPESASTSRPGSDLAADLTMPESITPRTALHHTQYLARRKPSLAAARTIEGAEDLFDWQVCGCCCEPTHCCDSRLQLRFAADPAEALCLQSRTRARFSGEQRIRND